MYPHTHLIAGLITALVGVNSGLINRYMAGVLILFTLLIDVDHYTKYYSLTKDFNLWKSWNYLIKSTHLTRGDMILHLPFAFIVITFIGIAAYFYNAGWSYVILGAYYTHIALDLLFDNLLMHGRKIRIYFLGLYVPLTVSELVLDLIGIGFIIYLL